MAVIWQKQVGEKRYEVRKAGQSTRLYTDGVFHSQYNPDRPITRGIWDLLMLPAFFYPQGTIKRVLVLGAGGGAVIHLLHRYVKPDHITAIDMDATHISIAKRFFGIKKHMATLIEADAVEWLKDYKGLAFDMIIDDLFAENEGEGVRAVPLTRSWFALLNRNLNKNGLLVANLFSAKELRDSAYCSDQGVAAWFCSAFTLHLPLFHNIVATFLKKESNASFIRREVRAVTGLNATVGQNQLQFSLRNITL